MRIAYTIVAIAYFAISVLRLKLKETLPIKETRGRPSFLNALRIYPTSVKECIYVWRKVPKSAFNLFLAIIVINGLVVSCQTYFVVYATTILKISLEQWAIVVAFRYLSIAVPGILAGLSMDVMGRKRFLILGYLLYVPGMLLFVNGDFNMLLLAFFFFGLGNLLQLNSYQVLMGDLVPRFKGNCYWLLAVFHVSNASNSANRRKFDICICFPSASFSFVSGKQRFRFPFLFSGKFTSQALKKLRNEQSSRLIFINGLS